MPTVFIPIVILGIAVVVVIALAAKSLFAPKRIATLASYVKQGKTGAATRTAKQILAREPRNPDAHYLLGLALLQEDKPELALMEFKTVNDIGRFGVYCREPDFRKSIARLYAQFKQPEEALKEYLMLMKLEPYEADHYYLAGRLFSQRNKSDRAADFYRKAIEVDSRHSGAHYELGHLLYRTKHPVEAKLELEHAIKYDPENFQAYFYLGRILKENHDYVGALLAFEKAQRDAELKTKSLVERGSCYMSMNNLDKAVTELERAVRIIENDESPQGLYGRYFLSLCYERLRRFEDAIDQWERIYAKKPSFRDVAEKLSQFQDLRTDDKMKDFLTASELDFQEICKTAVEALGLVPRDVTTIPNGCQVIGLENESKWRNARKMPRLIRFLRVPEILDVSTVRAMHEDMKKLSIMRGVIAATTRFSRTAMEFAETRPIELLDTEKLQKVLKRIPLTESTK